MTIYLPGLELDSCSFPPVSQALLDPDGLLAIGGDLSPVRLIAAYEHGIFPWFSATDPYLWWSPSVRAVINPTRYSPSKSLKKFLRKKAYSVSINNAFKSVITHCALQRGEENVWITEEMREAYIQLHLMGHAHSVEVWHNNKLIGGMYGVCVGALFCGESMFSLETNASKTALWYFCEHFKHYGGELIDCQLMTDHLSSLGAIPLSRDIFIDKINKLKSRPIDAASFSPQWITLKNE